MQITKQLNAYFVLWSFPSPPHLLATSKRKRCRGGKSFDALGNDFLRPRGVASRGVIPESAKALLSLEGNAI